MLQYGLLNIKKFRYLCRVIVNFANGFIGAPVSFQNGWRGSSGWRDVILRIFNQIVFQLKNLWVPFFD